MSIVSESIPFAGSDVKYSSSQRFREVGEIIESGDLCRTTEGKQIPASHSIGRRMRPENRGWVTTSAPATKETQIAKRKWESMIPESKYGEE